MNVDQLLLTCYINSTFRSETVNAATVLSLERCRSVKMIANPSDHRRMLQDDYFLAKHLTAIQPRLGPVNLENYIRMY